MGPQAKATVRKSAPKRKAPKDTGESGAAQVEAYLAAVAEPAQGALRKMRATILAAAPEEAEECISYGMPALRYRGALLGYAAFPNHCGLYPMSPPLIVEMAADLKNYETSKGAIRFAVDRPMPAALVKKIVRARVAENERRKAR